jgi:uncharacterized protein YaiL (DUF2058 family)
MSNPFQDKFLKAGLVNKKRANKAKLDLHKQQKEQRRNQGDDPVEKAAEQALRRQKEQSRQSNAQRDRAAREKEIEAQLKQLVASNRLSTGQGDTAFHFSDSNKIKKIYLPKAIIDQLSIGTLGIVKVDEKYDIVPAETAGKIRDRRPEALLVLNEHRQPGPNDPYAEFPVPDDYEW